VPEEEAAGVANSHLPEEIPEASATEKPQVETLEFGNPKIHLKERIP